MINEHLTEVVRSTTKKLYGVEEDPEIVYSDAGFGELSTNIAFRLAKKVKKPPQQIAKELATNVKHADIITVKAVNGFLNFQLSEASLAREVSKISPDYFNNNSGDGKKVQVEFISANPTGPLTLGNARGGFIGDVLANILEANGYAVTKEYYFNDAGTQIKHLATSVRIAGGIEKGEPTYRGPYIEKLAHIYKNSLQEENLGMLLTQDILKNYIEPSVKGMNIEFDKWFNEHDLVISGQFKAALSLLKERGLIYEKEGATWLKSTKYGDERDRVLVKSGGDITYLGNDIAYHQNIFEKRGFDSAIKIWGADHAGQVPSLKLTIKQLFPDKQLNFLIVQWVRLISQGREIKISKRAGTYITVDELVTEVGAEVARFFMLMRSSDTHMDFDLDLAKEQSQKNPLYYIMYGYARAHSILDQAAKQNLTPATEIKKLTDMDRLLIKQLTRLPGLVKEISHTYEVHKLTFYGTQLAKIFHELYEKERIIGMEREDAAGKLYLIEKVIVTMDSYFSLLGITPIKHM